MVGPAGVSDVGNTAVHEFRALRSDFVHFKLNVHCCP